MPPASMSGQAVPHRWGRSRRHWPPSSTTPAPSWPGTTGQGISTEPSIAFRSSLQTPLACSRTRTSPGPGGARSSSTTRSGVPAAGRSAARVVTASGMRGPLDQVLEAPFEPALAHRPLLERQAELRRRVRRSGAQLRGRALGEVDDPAVVAEVVVAQLRVAVEPERAPDGAVERPREEVGQEVRA